MFDACHEQPLAFEEPRHELETDALMALLPPVTASVIAPPNRGFELPRSIWLGMGACYAVFFAAIAIATGGSAETVFAITISILYTLVYFGVARILARQAGPEARSPLDRGEPLQTWCGPMSRQAVRGQILIVPFALAVFGIGIAVIAAVVL